MDKFNQLIDKLGGYFQLDIRYYIKNSFFLILAQGVSIGLSILLSIAFARLLTQDLYGQWSYILSIIGLLAIFSLPGMSTAINQAVARGHDRVLIEGTKVRFKWSILGSIAIFGVGIYYLLSGSVLLGKSLMICSLLFPFYVNLTGYSAFLSGKKQFDKVAAYNIIAEVISIPVTILIIYLSRNLLLILIAYLVTVSLVRAYYFWLTSRIANNASHDERAIPFGKQVTVTGIPGLISMYGDKILIGILLTFPELAVYSIALASSNVVRYLVNPIASLTFPKLSVMDEKEAYTAVKRRYIYVVLAMIVISGIAVLLFPFLIPFFYTQIYVDAVLYSQILLVGLIFGIPNTILTKALFPSQRKAKEIFKFEIVRIVIRTLLLVSLTLRFGLLGVPLAIAITTFLTMIYSWRLAKWI
ncbi:oligosaccharide flippase family protein [Chloroflexota bacterium]